MSSVPEDIYLQILLRLPVKSTCVCKCVCKTWLSLNSDPVFVDFTPHRNISNNLMLVGYDNRSRHSIHSISCDSLEPSRWENNEFISEMCYPYLSLGRSGYAVQFVGCCNGLVCLVFFDILDRGDNQDYAGNLVLYDPKYGTAIEREMGSVLRFSSEENYFESLVSVNSGTYARKGETEESTEAKEEKHE
ncbi:F-box/kelch-repeat protein At3g23880-like [Papaver somniferum]|uniref:F-box/kelch-repeat protein At3g23880-like n=1 Tax=Papaver somniferum TaxID=3469 RepID=UPI000E6F6C55|nr:F-box/kelch-repeat protein At3g23880-like [Papaver somniferum]